MATIDLVNDFSAFAASRLLGSAEPSIDELYEAWRTEAFREIDARAVMASVRDLEAGDRGQPLREFLADFDAERKDDA